MHGGGTSTATVNQRQNGGQWNLLGTYSFTPSAGHQVTLTAASDGKVIADAIRLVGTGPAAADLVYIHTDHLGTPQKLTDDAKALVWDRIQDPFGRQYALTSSGGIDSSLRFPGQQADPDTAFNYNYFRDYDPTLGRYIQSDPIGLAGGINTFAYVDGRPNSLVDAFGMVPGYGPGVDRDLAKKMAIEFQDCLLQCLGAYFGIPAATLAAGGTMVGLGQPVPGSKPFVTPGSSPGTSPASSWLREKLPQKLPGSKGWWAPTDVKPFGTSKSLGGFLGRWVPYVGWGLLAADLVWLGNCVDDCMECKASNSASSGEK